METQTQITVAFIAAVASCFGIIVNIIFSARISARQNKLELKKTRIELLERRRIAIQEAKKEMWKINIDLKKLIYKETGYIEEARRYYDEFYNVFLKIDIFFPKTIAKKMDEFKISTNQIVAEIKVEEDYSEKIGKLTGEVNKIIDKKLRKIEEDIESLLK